MLIFKLRLKLSNIEARDKIISILNYEKYQYNEKKGNIHIDCKFKMLDWYLYFIYAKRLHLFFKVIDSDHCFLCIEGQTSWSPLDNIFKSPEKTFDLNKFISALVGVFQPYEEIEKFNPYLWLFSLGLGIYGLILLLALFLAPDFPDIMKISNIFIFATILPSYLCIRDLRYRIHLGLSTKNSWEAFLIFAPIIAPIAYYFNIIKKY